MNALARICLLLQRRERAQPAGPVTDTHDSGMMVLPLPAFVLDMMFTFNIALSHHGAAGQHLYAIKPLDFMVFPTVLLLTTLLRLSLNVASTRVVLMEGHTGPDAAGKVIEAFGHFLIGGNYTVGIVVFVILVVINFMVITKGAGRIAEVARALHPGCDARQADGDRRRPERRPDRRGGSRQAPRRQSRRKRSSTARWTARANSCAATRSRAS